MEAVHDAAYKGDLAEIQRLITGDPSLIERLGDNGYNVLMIASQHGQHHVAEWLVDNGSDVEAKDKYGHTSLHLACICCQAETAALLLRKGADVNKTCTPRAETPLIFACNAGNKETVKALLSHPGLLIDHQEIRGWTALWRGVHRNRPEATELMLAAGADPRIARDDGMIPLDCARNEGHAECVALLEVSEPARKTEIEIFFFLPPRLRLYAVLHSLALSLLPTYPIHLFIHRQL